MASYSAFTKESIVADPEMIGLKVRTATFCRLVRRIRPFPQKAQDGCSSTEVINECGRVDITGDAIIDGSRALKKSQ
jgi:hypothetical protein